MTGKDVTNAAYIWQPQADAADNYLANALNQYTSTPSGAPTYDTNGNMTSDGVHSYIFDAKNQLVEARQGAVTIGTYAYDPLGRRSEKTASGLSTEYLYAGARVLAEYDGAPSCVMRAWATWSAAMSTPQFRAHHFRHTNPAGMTAPSRDRYVTAVPGSAKRLCQNRFM